MKFKDYILSEMSRASDRVHGKDSLENLLFILGDFLKKDGDPTYNRLSKFVEEYGLDWDTVANQLGISPSLKTSKAKAHLEYLIINVANKNDIDLYQVIDQVDRLKDEVDNNIDLFWDYYKAKHEADHEKMSVIEMKPAFETLVNWVKDKDETIKGETAEQAFGRHYDTVVRILKPFLMDDWEGSPEQAIEEFWNWHRAKKAGKEYTLSKETLERLATILESDQATYYFDNFYFYVAKEVGKMLGRKLLAPGEEPPLTKELKRIMAALDNPKVIDQIEAEEKRRVASGENGGSGFGGGSIGFAAIPAAALRRIVAIAAEDGAVDKNRVGKVDKAQVRQCYQYCMNQLNRKFHVGQKGAFDGTLQEFYDKFKIVFNRGYTIGTLKKIFDEVTTFLVDQLDQETANYWKNKEDVTLADTDDFNEAVRVARKHGYKIVKESAKRVNESKDNAYWINEGVATLLNMIFEYNAIGIGTSKIRFEKDEDNNDFNECINVICHDSNIGNIQIDDGHWTFVHDNEDVTNSGSFNWDDVVSSVHDMIDKLLPVFAKLCGNKSDNVRESTIAELKKLGAL